MAGLADKVQRLIGVFVSRYEPTSKMIPIRGFKYVIQSVNTTHRRMQKLTDTQPPHLFHTKEIKYVDIMLFVLAHMQTHTFRLRDSLLFYFSYSTPTHHSVGQH